MRYLNPARFIYGVSLLMLLCASMSAVQAQSSQAGRSFSRADTLRGANTESRSWWDAKYYDLHVTVNIADSTFSGKNTVVYKIVWNDSLTGGVAADPPREMQIDLQAPLKIDSVIQQGAQLAFRNEGAAYFISGVSSAHFTANSARLTTGIIDSVHIYYSGRPTVAKNPPWDGGVVWTTDADGNPWVATACQGIGASAWWPTKDAQFDEPDSQQISITAPGHLVSVSNGKLRARTDNFDGTATYVWFVANPINTYGVSLNVGAYATYSQIITGEDGALTLDFWPLASNLQKARAHFAQTSAMLHCFEKWFGPYPFYSDGFKLVETPYVGMEHQSAVAYGNGYANGYRGRDQSETGWGLKWDFIIVHESGHEWFGNNITSADIADMWVHETFTTYSEVLLTECLFGKDAGEDYLVGLRPKITNDIPVIGSYGVHDIGSTDMYYKGANMLHAIRTVIDNDSVWTEVLRGLNQDFRHSIVTGRQVQDYINAKSGRNFDRVFEQYLTTTQIPELEIEKNGNKLRYRWVNVVKGFDMPVDLVDKDGKMHRITPTDRWEPLSIDPSLLFPSGPAKSGIDPQSEADVDSRATSAPALRRSYLVTFRMVYARATSRASAFLLTESLSFSTAPAY